MFFENHDFPWTRTLQDNWETVRDEFQALPKDGYTPWPGTDLYQGKWNTFPFFVPGQRYQQNCNSCPETVRLVESVIPNITMASLSYLEPGAHIAPHEGFSHAVLRTHLALIVPEGETWLRVGGEQRGWEPGGCFIFDDMYTHEAYNGTEQPRVVLMCDFLRPFKQRTSLLGHIRQRLTIKQQMHSQWQRVEAARSDE